MGGTRKIGGLKSGPRDHYRGRTSNPELIKIYYDVSTPTSLEVVLGGHRKSPSLVTQTATRKRSELAQELQE